MAAGAEQAVHFYDLPAGQDRHLGSFEASREVASSIVPPRSARTFAMSPDGSAIFYVQPVVAGADLMLIENFR